jgi:molybdopterin-binding protein
VTARSVTELALTEGIRIVAAFKASAVHLVGRVSSDTVA